MADPSVLVDSSLWIAWLDLHAPAELKRTMETLLETNRIAITDMVRLEVIAGARGLEEFVKFQMDFDEVPRLETTLREWRKAETLSLVLNRQGQRVPAADTLIAAVAIAYGVPLWHADRDFERIRHVVGADLKTFWYPKRSPTP